MGRKKKLDTLKQVDGRTADADLKPVQLKTTIRSLDEIFGFQGAVYKTLEEAEYMTALAGMNKVDLQKECYRVHLMPNDDRTIMTERLLREFKRTVSSIKASQMQPVRITLGKEGRAILSEGANRPGI